MKLFPFATHIIIILLIPILCFLLAGLVLFPDTAWHQHAGANTAFLPELSEQIAPFLFGSLAELNVEGLTDNEASHLADVGVLVRAGLLLFIVSVVLVLLLLQFCAHAPRAVFAGAILTLVIPVLLAIVPFQMFFSVFHIILFPQGNYAFPVTSLLIQTYPAEFWQAGAITLFFLAALFAVLASVAAWRQK